MPREVIARDRLLGALGNGTDRLLTHRYATASWPAGKLRHTRRAGLGVAPVFMIDDPPVQFVCRKRRHLGRHDDPHPPTTS